ncbi:MAG: glycoside hydrolase family 9 protein [Bacteroidales bacterium]|nr:glycoside hydrolase family 9 protein [Bacteroidales bacterium]
MKIKKLSVLSILVQISIITIAQSANYDIRLNQIGFLPNAVKMAVVVNTELDSFKILTSDMSTTVFEGQFMPSTYYPSSGEYVRLADFTLMTDTGSYVLEVSDLGTSVPFQIRSDVFTTLSKATLKSYYFNRASAPVLSQYGNAYAREEGHPDTAVVVLPSAASAGRPAGTIISTPRGWYDAGDYNKYIVSSGISVFTLLSAYESFPEYYDTLNTNIPESSNAIPDILDEALWNIQWMMAMQDTDGGVYNKTTEANFSGFVMPSELTSTRYVCAKGTAATLDFGAIMAMTARIYDKYDPALADTALKQAKKAWEWANSNPDVPFINPSASGDYPAINTGGYGDDSFSDEFSWCAAELYISTKDSTYYKEIDFNTGFNMPGWPIVNTLGLLSLNVHKDSLTSIADTALIKSKLFDLASGIKNRLATSPYHIPGDFYYWAGNNAFANCGMLLLQTFRMTGNVNYYNAAVSTLDYLLGKNATTYSFVTGQGVKSPMHIHHRISGADGVVEPVPGLLVCGADGADTYDCGASQYPSTFPAQSYLDAECSYSTNEVAIGINAPLAFLAGGIQAEYQKNFLDSMAAYLNISTNRILLPYTRETDTPVLIEGNTNWSLIPSEDWIVLSSTTGKGSAVIQVNSDTDNPGDTARSGYIRVYKNSELIDSISVTQNGFHLTGPYFGTPSQIPGKIEAVHYDYGEINESWYDSDADNHGGSFRQDGVDIAPTWDPLDADGYYVGWISTGEWLIYTVDVNDTIADLELRVATWNSGGKIELELDGTKIAEADVPVLQAWTTVTVPEIQLEKGQNKELKLLFTGGFDFNWMNFKQVDQPENLIHLANEDGINIYPNPVSDRLLIKTTFEYSKIEIFNLEGKCLLSEIAIYSPENEVNFSLPDGQYILSLSNHKQNKTCLFFVVRQGI